MRKSEDFGTKKAADYRPVEIIRYNYAYPPDAPLSNQDDFYDAREFTGEPDETAAPPDYPWSYNAWLPVSPGGPAGEGQDKLISYTRYLLDGRGELIDNEPRFAVYEYRGFAGRMSRKLSYDGSALTQKVMDFTYNKNKVASVLTSRIEFAGPDPQADPPPIPEEWERSLEVYAYNIFGERIAVMSCTHPFDFCFGQGPNQYPCLFPQAGGPCKADVTTYDYADGRVLVERDKRESGMPDTEQRLASVYLWGPMGLVARRGVSWRNGVWDPKGGPKGEGAFEYVDKNKMCDYTYIADAMGNVRGLFDVGTAAVQLQTFDAFGNLQGSPITFQCDLDKNHSDWIVEGPCGPGFPIEPVPPTATARIQTGSYSWRGGEGSQTDLLGDDLRESEGQLCQKEPPDTQYGETPQTIAPARTVAATGLVFMQNRFYEPETGRFTQWDPLSYDPLQVINGQSNRWVYANNDPTNLSDAAGSAAVVIAIPVLADILASLLGALLVTIIAGILATLLGYLFGELVQVLSAATVASCLTRDQCLNLYHWCLWGYGTGCYDGFRNCVNNGQWNNNRWPLPREADPDTQPW
jgi:RHS repeat-associated protein